MITGITFDLQTVLSKNDGRLYQALFGSDYILYGCACNAINSGTEIDIAEGYVVVGGRIIHFDGGETKTLAPTLTTGYGRIVIDIDLTGVATATEFKQATLIEQYSTTETFQDLTKDDINLSGTHYQSELCRFQISSSSALTPTVTMLQFGGAANRNVAYINKSIHLLGDGTREINARWSSSGSGTSVLLYIAPDGGTEQPLAKISARGYIYDCIFNSPFDVGFKNDTLVTSSPTDNDNVTWGYFRAFKIPNAAIIELSATAKSGNWVSGSGYQIFQLPSGFRPKTTYKTSLELVQNNNEAILRNEMSIGADGWVYISTAGNSAFTRMKGKIIIPEGLLA